MNARPCCLGCRPYSSSPCTAGPGRLHNRLYEIMQLQFSGGRAEHFAGRSTLQGAVLCSAQDGGLPTRTGFILHQQMLRLGWERCWMSTWPHCSGCSCRISVSTQQGGADLQCIGITPCSHSPAGQTCRAWQSMMLWVTCLIRQQPASMGELLAAAA